MFEQVASNLDDTLMALADPTRRALLSHIAEGETRVTDLAKPFAMSLAAVSKHIQILERGKLVKRRKLGREHFISYEPAALDLTAVWIEEQRSLWTHRLRALDAMLMEEDRIKEKPE